MDGETAALLAARAVCQDIGLGTRSEVEGARTLWRIARLVPEVEPELRTFAGLVSEWDDDREHRAHFEEEIRSAALRFSQRGEDA
ncbi:hypothetical protein GCM10011519_15680 [Marmoricola endophyticus]|uniref:Uncharacterized protein n=1 Tax=Marmoricola endophyticus TaxID=2040280 RepID=A0A917F3T8_9ACTN|nr:hypothetical protein [Marmoricola endophyticus]GGF42658.1 hypothetical protein GCM10011519_15680 [Marmoricola endophyticus]